MTQANEAYMELQVYRIDRSLVGRVGHFFKKPDLPVMGIASTGLFDRVRKTLNDVTTDNCYILSEEAEINRFRNPLNEEWMENVYYIRHPKKPRTDCLIRASRYHSHIIGEQISEIVAYIRANANVKYLRVSITDEAGAKLRAKGLIEDLKVEGKVDLSVSKQHEVIITCHTPLKASEKRRDFVWMDDFDTTRTAIDDMSDSRIEIRQRSDFTGGLSVKVAELAEVSAKFLRCYDYHIECELA
jgi:hypothetical protein